MTKEPRKVLVVDDLPDWRATLRGLLAGKGFEVEVAESSDQAIQILETGRFDLALVDMRLDDTDEDNKDGLLLARKIRIRWPSIKIIIVTGYGTTEDVQYTRGPDASGLVLASDFVPKSDIVQLLTTIQRVLP